MACAVQISRVMAEGGEDGKKTFSEVDSDHIMVAAIDFGTTYTGYAASLRADPDDVFMFSEWGVKAGIPHSYKTPTCVLTDSSLNLVALGYDAQMKYILMLPEETKEHRFFQGFKMVLHNSKV